jgi:hypothetical protein
LLQLILFGALTEKFGQLSEPAGMRRCRWCAGRGPRRATPKPGPYERVHSAISPNVPGKHTRSHPWSSWASGRTPDDDLDLPELTADLMIDTDVGQ